MLYRGTWFSGNYWWWADSWTGCSFCLCLRLVFSDLSDSINIYIYMKFEMPMKMWWHAYLFVKWTGTTVQTLSNILPAAVALLILLIHLDLHSKGINVPRKLRECTENDELKLSFPQCAFCSFTNVSYYSIIWQNTYLFCLYFIFSSHVPIHKYICVIIEQAC